MLKRLAVALACAVCCFVLAAPDAEARVTYKGSGHSHAGTSRSCLKGSAQSLLNRIEGQFGRVQIISTCRPGARIRGTGKMSKHASGEAIDFNAPKGKKQAVLKWLMANHRSGGTMTYRGMNHIHVDIGYRFVSIAGSRRRA